MARWSRRSSAGSWTVVIPKQALCSSLAPGRHRVPRLDGRSRLRLKRRPSSTYCRSRHMSAARLASSGCFWRTEIGSGSGRQTTLRRLHLARIYSASRWRAQAVALAGPWLGARSSATSRPRRPRNIERRTTSPSDRRSRCRCCGRSVMTRCGPRFERPTQRQLMRRSSTSSTTLFAHARRASRRRMGSSPLPSITGRAGLATRYFIRTSLPRT